MINHIIGKFKYSFFLLNLVNNHSKIFIIGKITKDSLFFLQHIKIVK